MLRSSKNQVYMCNSYEVYALMYRHIYFYPERHAPKIKFLVSLLPFKRLFRKRMPQKAGMVP